MQLQAILGDATFDLVLDGDSLTVDGREVELRVQRLDERTLHLLIDGHSHVVTAVAVDPRTIKVTHRGRSRDVSVRTPQDLLLERLGMSADPELTAQALRAPMPGLVLQVMVEPGQEVQAGDGLVVLEAMKMENELRAELPGHVAAVHVQPGDAVGKNDLLVTFGDEHDDDDYDDDDDDHDEDDDDELEV